MSIITRKYEKQCRCLENTADLFNKIGAKCKEHNIQFGYHNHSFEFTMYDGKYGYDILGGKYRCRPGMS